MGRTSIWRVVGLCGLIMVGLPASDLKSQEKYNLSYDFTPGKVILHRKYLEGTMRQPGGDRILHLQYLDKWEVAGGESGQTIFTVRQTGSQYKGTRFDLREFGLTPENEPIERRMDVSGRVDEVSHYQKGSRYHLNSLTFPGKPVAVGESWKYSPTITFTPFGRNVNIPVNIIYTLEKVLNYKGRPCAKIVVSGTYRYRSETGDLIVAGDINGKVYFDMREKLEVDYEFKEVRTERIASEKLERNLVIKTTSLKE